MLSRLVLAITIDGRTLCTHSLRQTDRQTDRRGQTGRQADQVYQLEHVSIGDSTLQNRQHRHTVNQSINQSINQCFYFRPQSPPHTHTHLHSHEHRTVKQ